jgi:6-phosphogluconolactonase
VKIAPDPESLFRSAAEEFAAAAAEALQSKAFFDVALSGGSTPRGLFSVLVNTPQFRDGIAWDKIRFFWGDERHVPPDHADSNYRMAHDALLSHLTLRDDQVFRIQGELGKASEAAELYEQALRSAFQPAEKGFPRFDLILLGMGPDGHTASLFPGTKALRERTRLVVSNWVGKFYTDRITMTIPAINAAARVMFLVQGADKTQALKAVLEGPREVAQLPSQAIRPSQGDLLWLIDASAAAMLDRAVLKKKGWR